MTITIPNHVMQASGMTSEELLLELAILLFKEEKVTLAQAAEVAGLHAMQFQRELASRKIPIHYNEEDYERDLETIADMKL